MNCAVLGDLTVVKRSSFFQPFSEVVMTPSKHRQVTDELQRCIGDTQCTINRFEATGMEEKMPEDYETLLAILDDAVKQQQAHTLAMLGKP